MSPSRFPFLLFISLQVVPRGRILLNAGAIVVADAEVAARECVCVCASQATVYCSQQSTAVGGKAPCAFPSSPRTLRGCGCSYSNRRRLCLPFIII